MTTTETRRSPLLLTIGECSVLLRVSTSTVRRMIRRGELVALKLGDGPNRPVRVVESSLSRFLRQRLHESEK
jgi:excisionase family DNA binding protein